MRAKAVALILLTVAAVVWAGDPWKDKPYTQWDEKDLRKILNDSPWCRTVNMPAPWLEGRRGGADSGGISGGEQSQPAPSGEGGPAGGGGQGGAPGGFAGPETRRTPQIPFTVRWASSKTVRQAQVRWQVLHGNLPAEEAEKALAGEVTEYIVVVAGPNMRPFEQASVADLQQKSYLRPRGSKEKIAPVRVAPQRTPNGNRLVAIAFFFPMKAESGEASIPAAEKRVEFVTEAGQGALQVQFDLNRMTLKEGRDL